MGWSDDIEFRIEMLNHNIDTLKNAIEKITGKDINEFLKEQKGDNENGKSKQKPRIKEE